LRCGYGSVGLALRHKPCLFNPMFVSSVPLFSCKFVYFFQTNPALGQAGVWVIDFFLFGLKIIIIIFSLMPQQSSPRPREPCFVSFPQGALSHPESQAHWPRLLGHVVYLKKLFSFFLLQSSRPRPVDEAWAAQ
jgi:hypothetical protein